jgi:uncharacterized membrane protein YeaQ/YmgE (transglycosylase-associated protein family)
MKLMIFLGITIFGTVGGWIGASLFDHGNWFGAISILLSTIGSFFGVWIGFKAGKYIEP